MSVSQKIMLVMSLTFCFGAVIGSFLNVCIARIPLGESVVTPRSKCPECGTLISWYQNIPVASFLFLRGRCSRCFKRISIRYPFVELLAGVLFSLTLWDFGFSWATLIYWVFVSILLVIIFIDIDHQIIPNALSLPGVVIGFGASFMIPWLAWQDSLLGIIIGGGSLWLVAFVYRLLTGTEGMGMGDVKLLAMIGAFLGYGAVLPVVLISSFTGAIVGLSAMVLMGKDRNLAIPFGPFLSFGALVVLFWGDQLLSWYFSLF